jgi:hypothetical protein
VGNIELGFHEKYRRFDNIDAFRQAEVYE